MNPIELFDGPPQPEARKADLKKADEGGKPDKPNTSFYNEINGLRGESRLSDGVDGGSEPIIEDTTDVDLETASSLETYLKAADQSPRSPTEARGALGSIDQSSQTGRYALSDDEAQPVDEISVVPSLGSMTQSDPIEGEDKGGADNLAPDGEVKPRTVEIAQHPSSVVIALGQETKGTFLTDNALSQTAVSSAQKTDAAEENTADLVDLRAKTDTAKQSISNDTPPMLAVGKSGQGQLIWESGGRSGQKNLEPSSHVDETEVKDVSRFENIKGGQTERTASEIRPPTASAGFMINPVSQSIEQGQGLIADATMDDVELIRQLELSGSRDRVQQQSTHMPSGLQFSVNGARQVMGQVTAGLNQLADGTVEIRLNPVELGRITIHLVESAGGVQSANVIVEKPEVLDLLRRNEDLLGAEFEQAGLGSMSFSFDQHENHDENETNENEMAVPVSTPQMDHMSIAQSQIRSRVDLDIRL